MPAPSHDVTASRSGVLASLGASTLFGIIFVLPPLLRPLDPQQILGYRILAMIAFLAVIFGFIRAWDDVTALLRRCRQRPQLFALLVAHAGLLGVQLWVFGWAPQSGHGLEVSLGYLVLPLVMVVVGVGMFGEKLSLLRVLAAAAAAVGVGAAFLFAGGLGWPTLVVALGFPVYFISRRRSGLDTAGAQLLELVAMVPFSVVTFIASPSLSTVASSPGLIGTLLLLGLLSAAGFGLYLTASRVLPFALFGVLGYAEPVLLVVVSLTVLSEPWDTHNTYIYTPICLGLALLAIETARTSRRSTPAEPESPATDPTQPPGRVEDSVLDVNAPVRGLAD